MTEPTLHSFALAMELARRLLVARVRELPAEHALISFVWLDNETAGPWQPY